ncbi:dynamin family protein [Gottfriedia luciferensis]|uniref:dynamin family protein n=1 Tax=Gottfriedia luciferensis TaxID=178774 RepID=UPI000B435889|nr:dynamin family protein [Gottfriedia luciferensis]
MQNTKINRGELLNKVSSGIELLSEQQNSKELFQLKKLAYKIQNKESYYVFCGHFSAGKSSLLNDLLQVEKLPTSPIPTSANVVKLKSGASNMLITLKDGEMYQIQDDIQVDELKRLASDSASIIELEWSQEVFKIPTGTVLIDTPGIDSTDMDHLEATNSVIHLADSIFYLMDYQHVHSKTNIDFINSLVEKNNKVCLVITCIDKHDESELTFEEFKNGVVGNLKKQGLNNLQIFYISARDKSLKNNEYNSFINFLNDLYRNQEVVQLENDYTSFLTIMNEQVQQLENDYIEVDENATEIRLEFNELSNEIDTLKNSVSSFEENCLQTTQHVLNNSNITPFEMRELASKYLEAEKALQNKGLFQSRKKLENALTEAKQQFVNKVLELTNKQIEYFVKEAAIRAVKQIENNQIDSSEFDQILEPKLNVEIVCPKPSHLIDTGGNYLLQYTKEVSEGIKAVYRKSISEFIYTISKELKLQNEKVIQKLNSRKTELQKEIGELNKIEFNNQKIAQMVSEINTILNTIQETISELPEIKPIAITVSELINKNILSIQAPEIVEDFVPEIDQNSKKHSNEEIQAKYEIADSILNELKSNKFINSKIGLLLEKRDQIKSNEYTIALFGAFSSGKTSYINTLLGERVLPVSPHPTTAAICKIKRSTIDSGNKKADVSYKSEASLKEEFLDFFKKWGVEVNEKEWFSTLQHLIKKQKDKIPTDAFVYAESVCLNYEEMSSLLGTTKRYDLSDYVRVISEENRACFVKESTVYYDCEITLSGVVLVDTPGGNSIHSRHTELAFDYLKKADLILYVAHYQHAFTRQDESFLMQIGRMRESFDSDKVYFVLNASDLAKDQSEIEIVQNFFVNQLTKLGVRFPSVFAISSMLQMKGYGTSELNLAIQNNYKQLNTKIQNFFQYEIANEVFKTFMNDLFTIEKILIDTIKRFERIKNEKDQFFAELKLIQDKVKESIKNAKPTSLPRAFMKENEQLIFFIEKRIELRMRDLFPYFFNPSIFNTNTKNSKQLFVTKIREFIYEVLEEVVKELRVTGFRLEKFLINEIQSAQSRVIDEIHTIQSEFIVQKSEINEVETITISKPDQFVNVDHFENLKSYFKNPKSFFVENMKENMIDECIQQMRTPLKEYLAQMDKLFAEHYEQQYFNTLNSVLNKCMQQFENDVRQTIEATENMNEAVVDENVLNLFKKLI